MGTKRRVAAWKPTLTGGNVATRKPWPGPGLAAGSWQDATHAERRQMPRWRNGGVGRLQTKKQIRDMAPMVPCKIAEGDPI